MQSRGRSAPGLPQSSEAFIAEVMRISRMALTRDFKQTVLARAKRDPKFRQALFTEAINAYLTGDTATGKAMLRDLINATIGFEQLAQEVKKPSKSLHRMLAPGGNPNTENFFGIVSALQRKTKVRLTVSAL
jgi:DNA-binding phage protein